MVLREIHWTFALSIPREPLPVGHWNVQFANGVTQICEVRKDGTASIAERRRQVCLDYAGASLPPLGI